MWGTNIYEGFGNVPNMTAFDFKRSPPMVGSLMYGLITIGTLIVGKYFLYKINFKVRKSMIDKSKINRAIWFSYILIGLLTLINGLSFYLVKLIRHLIIKKM
jgi:hypothetical protein